MSNISIPKCENLSYTEVGPVGMANQTGLKLGVFAVLALWCGGAHAQSFNIDIDSEFAPPIGGGGVPSSAFGAAANQPGIWNKIPTTNIGNTQLRGLDGSLSSARIVQGGLPGGSGGGQNIPINTGDYALLLNDAREVGIPGSILEFTIEGIQNGNYTVYTYAVAISSSQIRRNGVNIHGSSEGELIVSGPMPGNQFGSGITHSVHNIAVSSGRFATTIRSIESHCWFNGMQIVYHPVPEPNSIISVSTGFLLLIRRGRQRRDSWVKTSISNGWGGILFRSE